MKNYKKKEATQRNKTKIKTEIVTVLYTPNTTISNLFIHIRFKLPISLFTIKVFFFVVTSHVRSFHSTAYSIADGWKTDKWLYLSKC